MYEILNLPSSLASTYVLVILLAASYLCYRISAISSNGRAEQEEKISSSQTSEKISQSVSKESEFPDNWWNGKDVFELERRAIFSKVSAGLQ